MARMLPWMIMPLFLAVFGEMKIGNRVHTSSNLILLVREDCM